MLGKGGGGLATGSALSEALLSEESRSVAQALSEALLREESQSVAQRPVEHFAHLRASIQTR